MRWCVLAAAAAAIAAGNDTDTDVDTGTAGCPCLEWADLGNYVDNGVIKYRPVGSLVEYDYPGNYGNVQCQAWDEGLPPLCNLGNDSPRWCAKQWCYVDRNNCDLPSIASRFFPGVENLHFSYVTCGNTDSTFVEWTLQTNVDPAAELITLLQDYLRASREQIERAFDTIYGQNLLQECGFSSTCDCTGCQQNSFWQKRVNLADVGAWLRPGLSASDRKLASCLSRAISFTYRRVAATEGQGAASLVGYQYFGDQASGGYAGWPNVEWCPANSFDTRYRDWYSGASTGPKDVVIVVDVSGSMGNNNRHSLAREATKAILDTLTWKDFASVVLFDSSVIAVFSPQLVSVTEAQRGVMKRWVDSMDFDNGGTSFTEALFGEDGDTPGAFKIVRDSVASGSTSMCQKAIMFLTDGQASFDDSDFNRARDLAQRYDVTFFTYALGGGADTRVAKQLACDNRGLFYPVPDGGDLPTIMSNYYKYFAEFQEMCAASFTEYTDAVTQTQLYAACLPMYSRLTPQPSLIGVTCMDVNMLGDIERMKNQSGWEELVCKMSDMSKTCRPIFVTDCHLEKMREEIGSGSRCEPSRTLAATCPCLESSCQDDASWIDEKGYFCDTWIGDNCNAADEQWGYSPAGKSAVLRNCPRSCGTCEQIENCPNEPAAACSTAASTPPARCRACQTDKVSGVDIEGCRRVCMGTTRVCDVLVSGARRAVLSGVLVAILSAAAAARAVGF